MKKKKKEYTYSYIGGYFLIKTKYISSFIQIKGFCKYISSVFSNWKILLVLFINFCSRIQKVKFKTEYKNKFKDFFWLLLNYIFSLGAFIGLYFLMSFCLNRKNKSVSSQNKEKRIIDPNSSLGKQEDDNSNSSKKGSQNYEEIDIIIITSLLIVFIIVSIVSLVFFIKKDSYKWVVYISIIITGSLNYFLNFYYSNQEAEFISLSGFIAISQAIFRILEIIFEPFNSNIDYLWQIIPSFAGIIFSIIYITCACKSKEKGIEEGNKLNINN